MKIFTSSFWAKRNVELYTGLLLRYGVILSCTVTFVGGVVYFIQHSVPLTDYSPVPQGETFSGVDVYLRSFSGILPRVLEFDGAAIIQLGVLLLIATPIFRVAFSVIAYLIEKDYLYVGITMVVLAIILSNMLFLK